MSVFRSSTPSRKADDSYVTEADHKIESYLRDRIQATWPADRIVGEEESPRQGDGDTWYLDPIDGTAAYSMELPIWAVSVGIWAEAHAKHGLLYAPFLDELFVDDGHAVYKNGHTIDDSEPDPWNNESLLCVPSDSHRRYQIEFPGKTRCLGSTAYHMALVLDGRAVGALLGRTRIWDMAAVVSMGRRRGLALRGVKSHSSPDWEPILNGNRPEEPLVFGEPEQIDRLVKRVEVRTE